MYISLYLWEIRIYQYLMIEVSNISSSAPYKLFIEIFERAQKANQADIDAICISTLDKKNLEIHSRMVNLKYIENEEWTFFSNYNSAKALQINSHNQISVLIFWPKINTQIRINAYVYKSSNSLSDKHFIKRSIEKNALAISSHQSRDIESYDNVVKNYEEVLNKGFSTRPDYWGGYTFKPYYFEFWYGHESRINKREVFNQIDGAWKYSFLQP